MNVDIRIVARGGDRTNIRIPILPESISVKFGEGKFIEYDIMGKGNVAIPSGMGLSSLTFESEFPGKYRTDLSMLRGSYKEPKYYIDILNRWKKEGTPVLVRVINFPINIVMQVSEFNINPAGFMGDVPYEIKFVEKQEIIITETKVEVKSLATTGTKRPSESQTTYVVKVGDNLWTISTRCYGSGKYSEQLYLANSEIIEQTAKKYGKTSSNRGWWIYPGTKLRIPQIGSLKASSFDVVAAAKALETNTRAHNAQASKQAAVIAAILASNAAGSSTIKNGLTQSMINSIAVEIANKLIK